jgi:3-hydroxyisobutyrate dehydrogenase-like beta-hydroxyacid dehydrogenase
MRKIGDRITGQVIPAADGMRGNSGKTGTSASRNQNLLVEGKRWRVFYRNIILQQHTHPQTGIHMKIHNIGIVSPGDMGQGVAIALKNSGFAVHTALDGRSERTKALAREAGIKDCGSMQDVIATCDVLLSILNPAAAVDNARAAAAAMKATGRRCLFVDCNAVAPQTAHEIDGIVRAAGGECLDAGIIGPPPRGKASMRMYVSGPQAARLEPLSGDNIKIRVMSERVGDAYAIKMCYAAYTKGAVALGVEMLMAARRLGVDAALDRELQESAADNRQWVLSRTAVMPPKAYRWVPEMQEIAKTFEGAGMTPRILLGAADMYEMIAQTALGKESPEEARSKGRDGQSIINGLAD